MDEFLDALLSENAYLNVHTTAHPGGEIRSQHGAKGLKAKFSTHLTGGNEVPAVDTDATGMLRRRSKMSEEKLKLEFKLVVCDCTMCSSRTSTLPRPPV